MLTPVLLDTSTGLVILMGRSGQGADDMSRDESTMMMQYTVRLVDRLLIAGPKASQRSNAYITTSLTYKTSTI